LIFAVRASQIEIAEEMLQKGADLHVQTKVSHYNVVSIYLFFKDRLGLAHIAARFANEHTIKWLAEKHMDFSRPGGVSFEFI
jgi:hypothetical protein